MKPFNFEEFKAGKPAVLDKNTYHFVAYDVKLMYPLVVRCGAYCDSYGLEYFEANATMLPTKRQVWIAIIKTNKGKIEPIGAFYKTKEEALSLKGQTWNVIDAIPYEIEE